MRKPDFFIIGAPKCGTTTLYHWLKQHPDIFMPDGKEPHYFAQNLSDRYCRIRDESDYLALFNDADDNQLCGEASVLYSFYPKSIKSILEFNPKAKFIFMIRNPVSMIPSYHRQLINNLEEDIEDFETAWHAQNNREMPKMSTDPDLLHYAEKGALGQHLKNIKELIPASQLFVLVLDDLNYSPQQTYKKTLAFLGLKNNYTPSFDRKNEAATMKSRHLQNFILNAPPWAKKISRIFKKFGLPLGTILKKINRSQGKAKPLSPRIQNELKDYFEKDIQLIEEILQRDLSHWRKED